MRYFVSSVVLSAISVDNLIALSFFRIFGESKYPGVSASIVTVGVLGANKKYWLANQVLPVGHTFGKKCYESCAARVQREVVKLVTGEVRRLVAACEHTKSNGNGIPHENLEWILNAAIETGMKDEDLIEWGLRATDALVHHAVGSDTQNTVHPLTVFEDIRDSIDEKVSKQVRRILVDRNKEDILGLSSVARALSAVENKSEVHEWMARAIRIIEKKQKSLL